MKPNPRRASWAWAGGAAALVLACRLVEIRRHTGDVAINDQWKIEAADLIAPWLDGSLRPAAFLAPHFEHLPVWTRIAAWLQVAVTGRWDPFVQTTVNSLLFAAFVFAVVRWSAALLRPAAALATGLLLVAGCVLPHAWENITWGFQSQFPFALLLLFLHVQGSCAREAGTRGWWWAQAAGFAGLFTLAGMWIAPLAVVLAALWTRPRGPALRLAPLALVALGLVLIAVIKTHAPPMGAFAQTAATPRHFFNAWLDLLGWPAGWPGAYLILNLPLLLLGLRLRGDAQATGFDRTVFALGLWGAGQAAALAYARGAGYGGYVSRYGELHLVLVLANALALARLPPPRLPSGRALAALFIVLWSGVVLTGWWQLATGGHTAHFHHHSAENARLRREAVQAYLHDGDRRLLEKPEVRQVLYQDVNQVTGLLDHPRFRALLPASVNPANPPDAAGTFVRGLQAHAIWIGIAGALMLLAGAGWLLRRSAAPLPDLAPAPGGLPPGALLAAAAASFGLLFCWDDPLVFGEKARWRHLLEPEGSVAPLEMRIMGGSHDYPPERLVGAAPLSPEGLRARFSGTDPAGPSLTCTAWSRVFPLRTPWLVVPYAGWPVSHGNGLRLRIEDAAGNLITEVACPSPNPNGVQFWTADVREFTGRQARLVLYDGRTETEAWVAAAAPIATRDPALAEHLAGRMPAEEQSGLHTSLAITALALFATGAGACIRQRRAGAD